MIGARDLAVHPKLQGVSAIRLERLLHTVDVEKVCCLTAERFSWKLWDGSPVNGQSFEQMKAFGMKFAEGGESFLVRDSKLGRWVHFQTFDPDASGFVPMSKERAEIAAVQKTADLARAETIRVLTNHVISKLEKDKQR